MYYCNRIKTKCFNPLIYKILNKTRLNKIKIFNIYNNICNLFFKKIN